MARNSGMTLMELLVCISIICILSCISIPLSGLVQRSSLETATSELLSDLRLAQQRSIAEGYETTVYFNFKNSSYSVYNYKNASKNVYVQKKFPDGISFDTLRSTCETTGILLFNCQGHPAPKPCTVTVSSRDGNYKSIAIGIATDYIYIKE